jgi:hypothetical protein
MYRVASHCFSLFSGGSSWPGSQIWPQADPVSLPAIGPGASSGGKSQGCLCEGIRSSDAGDCMIRGRRTIRSLRDGSSVSDKTLIDNLPQFSAGSRSWLRSPVVRRCLALTTMAIITKDVVYPNTTWPSGHWSANRAIRGDRRGFEYKEVEKRSRWTQSSFVLNAATTRRYGFQDAQDCGFRLTGQRQP